MLSLRPYQLLCLLCSPGESDGETTKDPLKGVLEKIRENPDIPIQLRCNAGDVYVYQDPGTEGDTPEGAEFNRKRDLDILQRLDLAPGSILPARTLLFRVLKTIPTVSGICGYDNVTAEAWKGCANAENGNYEKAHARGIESLIPPRSEEEMVREKRESLRSLDSAAKVAIRPHILMCAVCQYGSGIRPPFKADNLPELLEVILKRNPDLLITFSKGADWMMCAPCPMRVPKLNACVNIAGSGGLSNEKRDLDLLQKLGMTYGSTMKARDLLRLLFEKVPATAEICRRDNLSPSVWWDPCGEDNNRNPEANENYRKGRETLMEELPSCP